MVRGSPTTPRSADGHRRALGYAPLLVLLAASWGSSYLFIKVAVAEVQPAPMMAARLLLAAALLASWQVWRIGVKEFGAQLRRVWLASLVLGAINLAVPTWLVAWAEQHIDSGTAAIAQASAPLFVLILGVWLLPDEPISPGRVVGIGAGVVGVALLVEGQPGQRSVAAVGVLAVVASSLSYAAGGVYIRRNTAGWSVPTLVVGELFGGGLLLSPFVLAQLPQAMPSWRALGSVLALTLVGTVLAQLVLFLMLARHGAGRVSLVTYLMPAFALFYGRILLEEQITGLALAGLAAILAGVALAGRNSAADQPGPRAAPVDGDSAASSATTAPSGTSTTTE